MSSHMVNYDFTQLHYISFRMYIIKFSSFSPYNVAFLKALIWCENIRMEACK
uniref:Uncharacterized protein n=1 Tax=Arundo donax TaxID=35708 RepID=A0A0A9FQ29_ARUDO